ncbi:MAG TPA: lysylphosphatidylglycerol synthase transmembrane domain-containing protein [Chitinophagaceae bacterium]|nr:lysylphosphatidylglycerol synthase transmembrane domain-containing protein [Chitinophagaceae bacterium]
MNKRLRTILQYLFFFGLGIFLVWWSLRGLDKEQKSQISSALKNARYYLIAPVFLVLVSGHYFRAMRWRLLIESLGYKPGKANTFCAVMIGYLANSAFPRLGEVLKCTVLARYEKVPADKLVGTIILERVIDVLCLLVVFAITLMLDPGLYAQLADKIFNLPGDEQDKKLSGAVILLILFGFVILLIALWMIVKKKSFSDLMLLLRAIAKRIWEGISAIQHLKTRKQFILYTFLIWGSYFAGGYIGFLGLQETQHYGVTQAFAVLSAGSIGMTITPGGIGGYAFLIEQTMMVYGLQQGVALAFGWILWLANTIVILIGGLVSFVALPWYNKKKLEQSVL